MVAKKSESPEVASEGDAQPASKELGSYSAREKPDRSEAWARRRRRLVNTSRPYSFILPAMVLVFFVFVLPISWGFWTSLHIDQFHGPPDTPFVGFENYQSLFTSNSFWSAVARSLAYVGATLMIGLVLSLAFGVTLHELAGSHLKRFVRGISLVPWLISGVAVATIFRFMFNSEAGVLRFLDFLPFISEQAWLADPVLASAVIVMANIWYIVPLGSLLILAGLQMIDGTLYEAAAVDGATSVKAFRYITLPSIQPQIVLTIVILSFTTWNMFDLILTLTSGGPGRSTEVLSLLMYRFGFTALNFSSAAAVMMCLLVINVTFSIAFLRFRVTDN